MTAGFFENPRPDADNKTGLLGYGNKLPRRDIAESRIFPPQQGLIADHLSGGEGELRLVVKRELLPDQRAPQVVFQIKAFADRVIHRHIE